MKEIQHNKFSLIQIEKIYYPPLTLVGGFKDSVTEKCFIHLDTFDFLEEAQSAQKECKQKTLIISSWSIGYG